MEPKIKTNNNHIRLFTSWIASLVYYNAVECFLFIDRFWHIDILRYTYMDMGMAFVIYPVIAYLVCFLDKIDSKKIYYSTMLLLCFVYSFVVAYFNISHFPRKTWIVIAIFFCSIIVCVKINKIGKCIAVKKRDLFGNQVWPALISLLIVATIVITALCHAYIIV